MFPFAILCLYFNSFNSSSYSKSVFILVFTSYMPRAIPRVNYFLHFKNSQDLKILDFFAKLYPGVSSLVAMPNPRVMFIKLIITLNLG